MKIREIMSTNIVKATPDNTLTDIALMMKNEDIGVLPVVEEDELIGIVTDRDIVVRAIADGKDPSSTTVAEIVSEDVESVSPDDNVEKAAKIMADRQIRRLPVVEDRHVAGMVSLGDIAVKDKGGEGFAARALEGVSEGVKASVSAPVREASRSSSPSSASESPNTKTRKPRKRAA
jgi:CBS domain-containing protein